ncbi:CBO0543 family protein [Paenibacillus montanisoli]|uniref:DUF2878 domain-containing protein n=1 Tax=Paenibacillus montanisoli TaxID=2081970 RepID=A0A328U5Y4_9BACL|nr:CBO0543 family protein [Paenibacillus montanisoli]RAP78177.1 hypothetical protein DL346_07025 [Paenibacillus montanisoli]
MDKVPSHYEKVLESIKQTSTLFHEHWKTYSLFSTQFWVIILLTLIGVFIVWRLVDKSRLLGLLFYGLIWTAVAQLLDTIGTSYVLWEYPIKVTPMYTVFINNVFYLPLSFMLIYQYFRSWLSYLIASLIYSALVAFVIEPIHIWADLYLLINWKLIYSFPIYFVLAVLIRWFVDKVQSIQASAQQ